MTFDFHRILDSKRALRERLARLPVADKLTMLDRLRVRTQSLRAAAKCRLQGRDEDGCAEHVLATE